MIKILIPAGLLLVFSFSAFALAVLASMRASNLVKAAERLSGPAAQGVQKTINTERKKTAKAFLLGVGFLAASIILFMYR